MHEKVFVESILSNIKNKENLKEIFIEVGELAGITPEHLKQHLSELEFTANVSQKKSFVECRCGYEGEAKIKQRFHDFVIFSCPKCGSIPQVIDGDKIKIIKLVYEE